MLKWCFISHTFSCMIVFPDPCQSCHGYPPPWDERPHYPQTEGQVAWETEELDAGTSQVFDLLAWKHFFCLLFYFTTEYDMCFRALQYSCGCSPKAFLKKPGCITVASVSFFGQISDAVYGLVQSQTQAQYEAVVQSCEAGCPPLETTIRTDMDQIITSKEHVTSKIRGNFNRKFVPSFKSDTGVK